MFYIDCKIHWLRIFRESCCLLLRETKRQQLGGRVSNTLILCRVPLTMDTSWFKKVKRKILYSPQFICFIYKLFSNLGSKTLWMLCMCCNCRSTSRRSSCSPPIIMRTPSGPSELPPLSSPQPQNGHFWASSSVIGNIQKSQGVRSILFGGWEDISAK